MTHSLQINWGPFIDEAGWADVQCSSEIFNGTMPPHSYASKLGTQKTAFQVTDEQYIVFTFMVDKLPANLAYNPPSRKKNLVYTNYYWCRFTSSEVGVWSEQSEWKSITYIK
jgi:hypothetical protein